MRSDVFPRMHVSLYVKDILATVQFYEKFFGRPADKVKQSYAKFVLPEPSLIISFVENEQNVRHDFGHFGFQVATEDDLLLYKTRVLSESLEIKEEIGTRCCYALQDKFWVADPDGYQWEVYLFHEDAEFNDPHYAEGDAKACCTNQKTERVAASACCAHEVNENITETANCC